MKHPARSLLYLSLLAACTAPVAPEKRAAAYWNARREMDLATCYQLEAPGTRGEEKDYLKRMSVTPFVLKSAEIAGAQLHGNQADVMVNIKYRYPLFPRDVQISITDAWIRVGRAWFHKALEPEWSATPEKRK